MSERAGDENWYIVYDLIDIYIDFGKPNAVTNEPTPAASIAVFSQFRHDVACGCAMEVLPLRSSRSILMRTKVHLKYINS